jgi:2'-5' RNA ligase
VLLVPVPAAAMVCAAAPGGLPPHVTVLFPFLGVRQIDGAVVRELEQVLGVHAWFDFALTAMGRFPGVLYLASEPADRFRALTEACAAHWPQYPPYGGAHEEIVPHLTLFEGPEPPDLADRAAALLPIRAQATEVWLMTQRGGGSWRRRAVVSLHRRTG